MSIQRDRIELERDLGRALSRHIGYTTGAYNLDRIVSTLDIFRERPSVYRDELAERLGSSGGVNVEQAGKDNIPSMDYRREIINFAEAMSLIFSVSKKGVRMRRFAPTETGRALLGARASNDEGFYNYFLTRIVLLADADALYPVLDFFSKEQNSPISEFYLDFQNNLRSKRANWLEEVFRERSVLERLVTHIPWLYMPCRGELHLGIKEIVMKTAWHQSRPRKGWLNHLGLLDKKSETLTQIGHATLNELAQNHNYFWLGPISTTQDQMRIPLDKQKGGIYEDTFELMGNTPHRETNDIDQLLEDTANVMRAGYAETKLVHAAQATLVLPIEFIKYRAYLDQRNYEWNKIVADIFVRYRGEFQRLSAKRGQVGFYKWNGDA